MPTIRKLTPEELAELQAQGIDVSQIETEVEVLTPEEQKQLLVQQALGSDTGRGSAISNTLKAHAGSYVGGGVGAGLGMAVGAALAPETFGLSLLIPALTTAAGGAAGGYAGGKLQQAVLPTELEEKLQEKAAASHELYPWTTGATDLLAGTIAGGGKPSLKGVKYALKGLNQARVGGGVIKDEVARQALQNVTVGNAVGAGVNTGLQLAQTGTVDPKEVALNLVGGAFMSEPSALGRKLSLGHWKPLADVRGIEVQDNATPVTLAKSGIKTLEGHNVPENVEEVVARNTKAEKIAAEEAEYSRQWQEKADAIEAEQNRIIAEHQAKQQKMADLFAKNDWRDAKIIPDKAVKKAFYNRFKQTAPKGASDLEVAAVEAANKRVKEVPVEAMRQELWQQDFASYDPEGFAAYQAKQKAAQEAQAAKLAAMRQSVEQQNAAIAEAQARQQRLQDFVKAQKEVAEQQAKEQRIAEQKAAEQAKAEFKARRQAQLRGQLNPQSVATQMQSGIAAPEQRPTPFEVNRFRRPFNEVKGEPTTAEEMQHDYDLEQGDKYQAEGEGKTDPTIDKLGLREAAKNEVEVGVLPDDEALPHPQGGEARGINFNPETIKRRLFALSRRRTVDSLYHETLHTLVRDMRQSNDPQLRRLAQRMINAAGGEENLVQGSGVDYEKLVKQAAGSTFSERIGKWYKDTLASVKTMVGSNDPDTLSRVLINIANQEAGTGQNYIRNQVGGSHVTGIQSRNEYSDEGYKLTKEDAQEVWHKLQILADSEDLQADYNLTQEQADALVDSIPKQGGVWNVPEWGLEAVKGEMQDHANVLRNIASDALDSGERGQSLRIHKQAKRFEDMFQGSKDDTLEGYRKVTVRRPDGTSYEANFNDKYYTSKGGEKLASLAFKQDNGEWTHGMAKSGEKIEDDTQYQGPEEDGKRRVAGADLARSMRIFGSSMYDKKASETTVKELFQNAFDAVKNAAKKVISLHVDDKTQTIEMDDSGSGMTPEIVVTKFLRAYASGKEAGDSAGGYGLAKIAFLGGAEEFKITTVAETPNGKLKTLVDGTGEAWHDFVNNGAELPVDINKPGVYVLDSKGELSLTVKRTDDPTGTKATVKPKNYTGYEARNVFKEIANYAPDNLELSMTSDGYEEGSRMNRELKRAAKDYSPIKSVSTDGADITIKYNPNAELVRQWDIPVTNNGLKQFGMMTNVDVKLPPLMIEVKPKVDVENPEYPYTTNRDGLKGPAKDAVDKIIKELAQTYKMQQLSKYKQTMQNRSSINGDQQFLDLSGKLTVQERTMLANHPFIQQLTNVLARSHKAMFRELNNRYGDYWLEAQFKGLAHGGDFQGVRFGITQKGAQGDIYYDVGNIMDAAEHLIRNGRYNEDEHHLAFSRALSGVTLHELAHQISFEEGETHAIAMTDLGGILAEQLVKQARKVENVYDNASLYDNFRDWYRGQTEGKRLSSSEQSDILREAQRNRSEGQESTQIYRADRTSNEGSHEGLGDDTHYQAPEKAEPNALLPFLTSRVDKIAKRFNDETGHYVATTLHKFSGYADMMIGRIGNKLVSIGRDLTPEQLDKVYHHLHDIDNTGSSEISLTSNESRVARAITEALREPRRLQQKEGLLVKQGGKLREAGIKPEGYMFNILDRDVAYEWAEHPDSAKAKAYDEAYIEHQKAKGADDEEAAELLAEYKGALGSQLPGGVEFGALRRAEGNGLPWELVDKNFASASMRYARRAARDLSFFKFLQNDSKMRKALNLEDQEGRLPSATDEPTINRISGSQEVQEAMRSVYSIDTPRSKVLMAAARAVGNTVMGVGTAIRNIANIPAFLGAYVQTGQLPKVFEAVSKMNESRARAFENNAVRTSFKDFDAAGYVQQDPNPLVNLFNKFTDYARKYQGRDFSDKFEGEFYYSLGELLAVDNIAKAKAGNAESRRFVKRFGDIVEGGSERLLSGEVTQDDISRIAKRFVDGARGTYSEEGLPSWAIEGEIAPFTALSRFSIEKANTIYKDVVVPAREGNYAPLLRYTLASLGVGLGIEELNELLSGKRGPDPKLNEVLAAGDAEDLTAKTVGLLQLASFAGIVADGAKAALQISKGKSRFSSPLSFPLYTLVTDTIAGNLGDAVDAIHQGENPFDVMGELAINVASQSVQTLRYVDNNLLRPEDTARREKFRDVEVFKDLEGGNTSETTDGANPYLGINSRKFKRATNIDEALQLLPGLINKAFEKAGGDIEKLRNELRKLKNVSYQTMPSLENAPLGFLRYLNYLKITQGEQAMSERLRDYLEQNAINDVKAQMVP